MDGFGLVFGLIWHVLDPKQEEFQGQQPLTPSKKRSKGCRRLVTSTAWGRLRRQESLTWGRWKALERLRFPCAQASQPLRTSAVHIRKTSPNGPKSLLDARNRWSTCRAASRASSWCRASITCTGRVCHALRRGTGGALRLGRPRSWRPVGIKCPNERPRRTKTSTQ